jgi:hypothetical protein
MANSMTDEELRAKAWNVLKAHLGPADAMRFLSMSRSQPREYLRWRDEHFKGLAPDELIRHLGPPEATQS